MSEPIEDPQESVAGWEPRIVAFFCNWCTYTGGRPGRHLPHEVRAQRAHHPGDVLRAGRSAVRPGGVRQGADGVLIGGCHPGDCHYQAGNHKALRRFQLLKRVMAGMGIEEERVRLEWISAAEGDKLRDVMNDMVARLRALGPLHLEVPDEGPEAEGRAEEAVPAAAQELAEVTA